MHDGEGTRMIQEAMKDERMIDWLPQKMALFESLYFTGLFRLIMIYSLNLSSTKSHCKIHLIN